MTGKLGFRCKGYRCSVLLTGDERYCPKCADQAPKAFGAKRVERLPFYNTMRWKRLRMLKLRKNPVCEVCQRNLARAVHHVKMARDYPELRFDINNLQSICISCHAAESQREATEAKAKANVEKE